MLKPYQVARIVELADMPIADLRAEAGVVEGIVEDDREANRVLKGYSRGQLIELIIRNEHGWGIDE